MTKKDTRQSRRDFLKLAGTAAPAVAVATVAGSERADAAEAKGGKGLPRTEHVKKYLASARF